MTRAALLALALLCASCVQSLPVGAERPPRDSDLAIVDAVSAAWRTAGNPWTSRCREERADRMVVVRSAENVASYCASNGPCCGTMEKQDACRCSMRTGGPGCAAGATTWESDIVDPLAAITGTYRVMLWLSPFETSATQKSVLAHEAGHWILRCATGNPDPRHARADMWSAGGFADAAE